MHPAFNDIYSALGACLPCCVIILSQNSIKEQVLIIPGRKCPCRCDLQEITIYILPANDVKTYMKTQKSVLLIPFFERYFCKCFMNLKKLPDIKIPTAVYYIFFYMSIVYSKHLFIKPRNKISKRLSSTFDKLSVYLSNSIVAPLQQCIVV